jgi:Caspase domain
MSGHRSWFLLTCIWVALLAQLGSALADKRIALVIGNSSYKNTPALANPGNDATDIAQAIGAVGFQVTLKLDADKREMDQAIAQFAREATTADTVLFYYAGHGMQFQGANYIMPVDAELQDEISLRYEMTAVDEVKAALQRSNGVKIMVLDSCRNNPLAAKLSRSISVTTRAIPNVQGYARPEKTRGMIIVYATQADDVANDGVGRNSPFSTAFLKEIKEPGLEIGTMFRRIGGDVYQATNGAQSPELSISLVPEYYLNQAETDQSIWARIRSSADPGTIREFLVRFPNSFYAPDARARLDLLDRAAPDQANGKDGGGDALTAEAERLKVEQIGREREAEAARTHERELVAKLAEAEAERQKLTAQLAQRENATEASGPQQQRDQSVTDAATNDSDGGQHRPGAAAAKQQTEGAPVAGQNSVGKEFAERSSQTDADQARALKLQIAQLELQALQAKSETLALQQKSDEAKNAAESAQTKATVVASTSVAAVASLTPDQASLVGPIQAELRRLGCNVGGGDWGSPLMARGIAGYARLAKLESPPAAPSLSMLTDLKSRRDRICVPECSPREVESGGRCIAKVCGPNEVLARNGQCIARSAPPRMATVRDVARAPAAAKGHCFSFNGNQYCE